MASKPPVVVTGASGFVAKHVIAEFLKRGEAVRGTLRSLNKAEAVQRAVTRLGANAENLSFAATDLLSDDGWEDAFAGAQVVVHTASPFPMQQPEDPEEIIGPARDGTLRVLKFATRAGAKRLVLTSSIVAIFYGSGLAKGHTYSEDDFTDEARPDLTPYFKSKTIAEKVAWQFVKANTEAPELAVINPGFVQGPAPDADLSTSHELFLLLARGAYPAAPKLGFPIADVRDVAAAHYEAAIRPEAAGNRYLIAEGTLGVYELGQILARELPELRSKVPKIELPDFSVRMLSHVDRRLKTILPELGDRKRYTNSKAQAGLGLKFRSADEASVASIRSLRELGLI